MKKSILYRLNGLLLTLLLLALDQLTKYLAGVCLPEGSMVLIPGFLELSYLENQGAAFGMLQNRQIFFIAAAVLILALLVYGYLHLPDSGRYHPLRAACVLLAAGAAGNMLDRLLRQSVTDFIYISLINFPVFNLADCFVCAGIILAVLLLLTKYRSDDLFS